MQSAQGPDLFGEGELESGRAFSSKRARPGSSPPSPRRSRHFAQTTDTSSLDLNFEDSQRHKEESPVLEARSEQSKIQRQQGTPSSHPSPLIAEQDSSLQVLNANLELAGDTHDLIVKVAQLAREEARYSADVEHLEQRMERHQTSLGMLLRDQLRINEAIATRRTAIHTDRAILEGKKRLRKATAEQICTLASQLEETTKKTGGVL